MSLLARDEDAMCSVNTSKQILKHTYTSMDTPETIDTV
jgi:hypothetical protein